MEADRILYDKCDAILSAAELPTPGHGWVKDTWFVNTETGEFFPVYAGRYGLSDYARHVDGETFVSAPEMERRGFMQHYFENKHIFAKPL